FSTYNYRALLKLTLSQREHLLDEFVQIDRAAGGFFRFEHRADALDHFGGPLRGMDDLVEVLPNLIKIRWYSICPAQTRIGTCRYGGQWLIDLVNDRSGHGTNATCLCCSCKLLLGHAERILRLHFFRNVKIHPERVRPD